MAVISPLVDKLSAVRGARDIRLPDVLQQAINPFWTPLTIDESRWDKLFPYQLLLLESRGSGTYAQVPGGVFTLPIPPQEIQDLLPFAISTEATLGGIVEQHNGIPIRPITISGTMGVMPLRPRGSVASTPAIGGLFAGTLQAVQRLKTSTAVLISGPQAAFSPNLVTDTDLDGDLKGTTGYYQFMFLRSFLEGYANLKKTAAGNKYRLAWADWKTKQVLLITPTILDGRKSASSPHEWTFTLAFKAWRRINIDQTPLIYKDVEPIARNPSALRQLLTRLDQGRRVVANLRQVLEAVRGDVNTTVFEPLRLAALFVKDALGVSIAATDLPAQIIRDMKEPILEAAGIPGVAGQARAGVLSLPSRVSAEFRAVLDSIREHAVTSGKASTGAGTSVSDSTVSATSGGIFSSAHPANKVLDNPQNYWDIFSQIHPGDLNLRPTTTKKIVDEREKVRQLTRSDFETMRNSLEGFALDFADAVGLGSATFNKMFQRATPASNKAPTNDDYEILFNLNQMILELNRLAASGEIEQDRVSAMEYISNLARGSGIDFRVPNSERLVPFPYGSTLEQLAYRYLGDAQRWHEIAALNQLREPYVDELGFDLVMLTNGNQNSVVVADGSNLYVGQSVWISSSLGPKIKRHIVNIDRVADGNVIVTVDGDPTLGTYTTAAGARLHAFLPGTVNSQMLVALPDDGQPTSQDFQAKAIPGLDELDTWLRLGGVDLLLTQSGDAAITPDGDWRLAVGMANLIQRARTFFGTPRGSLMHAPSYGFPLTVGESTADVSAQQLLDATKDISGFDPVFSSVQAAQVVKSGPSAQISVNFALAGTQLLLPLTFDLKR